MATPLSADRLLAALKAEGVKVSAYRSWRTHNEASPDLLLEKDAQRFWAKVKLPLTPDGCMEWTAADDGYGYGAFRIRGRTVKAHRVSYEHAIGPIPDGLVIDHLCRNRLCVRTDHMELVTRGENVRRGIAGEVNGERNRSKTHCPQGHPYSAENTYTNPGTGRRNCRSCHRSRNREYMRGTYRRKVGDDRGDSTVGNQVAGRA